MTPRSKYNARQYDDFLRESQSKREPRVIDVQPDELIREYPCTEEPRFVAGVPVRVKRSRRTSAVRELEALARAGQRIARAVETPDFWLGVAARLLERR